MKIYDYILLSILIVFMSMVSAVLIVMVYSLVQKVLA